MTADNSQSLPVAPLPELGSTALRDALVAKDVPSLLEAIAYDAVVVPIVEGAEPSTRVFPSRFGPKPYDLLLFSSAKTLSDYLGPCAHRSFVLRHGVAVLVYLSEHLESIEDVVFDPGSEHEATTSAEGLAAFVASGGEVEIPVPSDDPAADPADDPAADSSVPAAFLGYEINVEGPWGSIDLRADNRKQQIDRLVKMQTASLGDDGALVRHQIREWLTGAADQAASGGGEQIAFLLAHHRGAAVSLSMMKYWHDLGPQVGPISHLDAIVEHLGTDSSEGEQLEHLEADGNRIVRHSRTRSGASEMGGSSVPLALADYWVACPDGRHVAHVSFSTPHVDQIDTMLTLMDNVALQLIWVTEDHH